MSKFGNRKFISAPTAVKPLSQRNSRRSEPLLRPPTQKPSASPRKQAALQPQQPPRLPSAAAVHANPVLTRVHRSRNSLSPASASVAISDLTRVAGIGPVKARELVDQGITSIEELKGIADTLTKGQRIGLKHFEDFELRIPRAEIKVIKRAVKEVIGLSKKYTATVCGSYRRGLPSSGDVDFLLTHK